MNKKVISFLTILLLAMPMAFAQEGVKIKWIEPSIEEGVVTNTAPTLNDLASVKAAEGETITVTLETFDLEDDPLTLVASELPEDSKLEDNVFTWTPSYEFVQTKSCWYYWISRCKEKTTIDFIVSDGRLQTTKTLDLTIADTEEPKDDIELLIKELSSIIDEGVEEEEVVEETVEEDIAIAKEVPADEVEEVIAEAEEVTEEEIEEVVELEEEESILIEEEVEEIEEVVEEEEAAEEESNWFISLIRKLFTTEEIEEEETVEEEEEVVEEGTQETQNVSGHGNSEGVSGVTKEEDEKLEEAEEPEEVISPLLIEEEEVVEDEVIEEEEPQEAVEEEEVEEIEEASEGEVEEQEEAVEEEITSPILVEDVEEEPVEAAGFTSTVNVKEGQKLEIALSVQDPDMDEVFYSAENMPEGAVIDNGTFIWTPDNTFVEKRACWYYWITPCSKEQLITFIASDQELETRQSIEVKVTDQNAIPVVEDLPDLVVNERELVKIEPNATDADGDKIKYRITDPFDKNLEWTPAEGEVGNFSIKLTANDGSEAVTKEFIVTVLSVEATPVLNSYTPEEAHLKINEGENISFSAEATDDDGDELSYSWKINSKEVSTNETMTLYTTYTSTGAYIIALDVVDTKGNAAQMAWTVNVEDINRAPALSGLIDITVNEGELVTIELNISDEDQDKIYYQVSEPIGNDLKWQTDYEDAGEYVIEVTITDGIENITEQITVVVNNVNAEQPRIESYTPSEKQVTIMETESIKFSITATDPDGEEISYKWLLDGETESTESEFELGTDYESEGVYNITAIASDGEKETSTAWELAVKNKNRAPNLDTVENVSAKEGALVELELPKKDDDGDNIYYTISTPFKSDGTWQTGHEDAGVHEIEITATDTKDITTKTIIVEIEDENRVPLLTVPADAEMKEGETIKFEIEATDLDGNKLELSAEDMPEGASFDDGSFEWAAGYDAVNRMKDGDSKEYEITFVASDGTDEVKDSVTVTVKNVNRPPVLEPLGEVYVKEGNRITLQPIVNDPDGDEITATYAGWMTTESKTTSYEDEGKHIVTVTVSDGFASDSEAAVIIVGNTNRAPVFGNITAEVNEPTIGMVIKVDENKVVGGNWLTGLMFWK